MSQSTRSNDREDDSLSVPLLPQSIFDSDDANDVSISRSRKGCRVCWLFILPLCLVLIQFLKLPLATHVIRQTKMEFKAFRLSSPGLHSVVLSTRMSVPLSFPSQYLDVHLDSFLASVEYAGVEVGTLRLAPMDLSSGDSEAGIELPPSTLDITNMSHWAAFSTAMIHSLELKWTLRAPSLKIQLMRGLVSISNVPLVQEICMTGMNGLVQLDIASLTMDRYSTSRVVKANVLACLYNPSLVQIEPVGHLVCLEAFLVKKLNLSSSNDTTTTTIPVVSPLLSHDLALSQSSIMPSHVQCQHVGPLGYNAIELVGELVDPDISDSGQLIQQYAANRSTTLRIRACGGDTQLPVTDIKIYERALSTFTTTCDVHGLEHSLLSDLDVHRLVLDPESLTMSLESHVTIMNPLGAKSPIELYNPTSLSLSFSFDQHPDSDDPIAIDNNNDNHPIAITIGHLRLINGSHVFPNGSMLNDHEVRLPLTLARVPFQITNLNQWSRLLHEIMYGSTTIPLMRLSGESSVWTHIRAFPHVSRLALNHLPLSFDKLKWTGMNNFTQANVTIVRFTIQGSNTSGITEMTIQAKLYNPSIFQVPLNDIAFSVWNQDLVIGHITTSGITHLCALGWTTLDFTGRLDPPRDPTSSANLNAKTTRMFSQYLQNQENPMVIKFKSLNTSRVWFRQAFVPLALDTSLPGIGSNFSIFHDVPLVMSSMEIQFRQDLAMQLRFDVAGRLKLPPSLEHLDIDALVGLNGLSFDFGLEGRGGALTRVGRLEILETDAVLPISNYNRSSQSWTFGLSQFYPMSRVSRAGMSTLITQLVFASSKTSSVVLRLLNTSWINPVIVNSDLGQMHLRHIQASTSIHLSGMNQFRDAGVKILELDIVPSESSSVSESVEQQQHLRLKVRFSLVNPSVVAPDIESPLDFQLYSVGFDDDVRSYSMSYSEKPRQYRYVLGHLHVPRFHLECCGRPTVLQGSLELVETLENQVVLERFLSDFVSGYFTSTPALELAGSSSTSNVEVLKPMFHQFRLQVPVPTLARLFPTRAPTILVESQMYWSPDVLFHLDVEIPIVLELRNPFSAEITLVGSNLVLYPCRVQKPAEKEGLRTTCDSYSTQALARFQPQPFVPVTIPGHATSCFSCCRGKDCHTRPMCRPSKRENSSVMLDPVTTNPACMTAKVIHVFSLDIITSLVQLLSTTGLLMYVNGTLDIRIGTQYSGTIHFQQHDVNVHLR